MSYEKIKEHADKGHVIEFAIYGNGAYALECTKCDEIVADFEEPDRLNVDVEAKLAQVDFPDDHFDDLVIDHCMSDATAINNAGFSDQLEFLHSHGEDIEKLLSGES